MVREPRIIQIPTRTDSNLSEENVAGKITTLAFLIMIGLLGVENTAQSEERLVWPPPPQHARIEHLKNISNASDLGIRKSFFDKLKDVLFGKKREGALVKPLGIFTDHLEIIYVTDPGAGCVHIFDLKNKKYKALRRTLKSNLFLPVDVTVDLPGNIYVTDSVQKKVIIYNHKGKPSHEISGYFLRPTGITILNEKIYVSDTEANKIFVFTLNGQYLNEFGHRGAGLGEFNFPVFLTSSKYLYLTDAMNHRVQILDEQGRAISAFGEMGDVQGTFANPKGIAVDSEGHIYVSDGLFNAVQIFTQSGDLLLVVGNQGTSSGEFSMPSGISIDESDKIYVVDALNRRVQIFQYLKE